jgi:hypothetical protein
MVAVELQGQLLAWERVLDSREGAIAMWEDGLAALSTEPDMTMARRRSGGRGGVPMVR